LRRRKIPVHVVATGSSALRLASGSRESLAGRFERLTLTHWSAASLASRFGLEPEDAAGALVRTGAYPGAFGLRKDPARWLAYVRDAILEPALGRDIVALAAVRRPALLRQVFALAASSPAQILSLQKIQGQLQDRGALETIAHYLALLDTAPQPLPEAGQSGLGAVSRGVDRVLGQPLRQLEEERCLADLARPRQQLDATGRRFGNPSGQALQALSVAEDESGLGHSRIIIRLWQRNGKRRLVKEADRSGAPRPSQL